jgi:hypothetical protein
MINLLSIANQKTRNIIVTGAILLLSSACGGGGGGSSTPALPSATVSISASATSAEVNSTISVTWSSTLASSCSASGAWSGTKATSGTEEVTIAQAGSNSFSLSCSGSEITTGSSSVAVEGFRYFGGLVIDGYLRGATVYIDANDNFTMDSDEPSVTTDNLGSFSNLKYLNGTLVSEGGIDLDTGVNLNSLQLTNKLSGHSDIKVITPLTTLAAAMSNPENINTIFGIDAAVDIGITDPIPSLGDRTYDNIYEKGNQLTVIVLSLQNSMNAINASTDNSKDYFASIGEEIETAYAALEAPGIIDIESAAFISAVVENIVAKKASSTSDTIKENIKIAIGSVIPIIQVKTSASVTTAIQNFSFGTLQTDMQSIATDAATPETLSQYASGILNYVATDQNVAISDLEVDITALNDAIVLDEDSSIEISPLSNDSYLRGQSISISSSSSAISGQTTLTGNIFTYTPTENFNGSDSFTYTINQGSKSDTGTINITVTPVNDLPVITSAGSITVSENQTALLSINVTEVDGDELTYAVSGTDSASFSVDTNGVITFNAAPDYETKNAYAISYSVSDGTDTVSQDLAITIKDENDVPPTISNLATSIDVVENTTDVLTVSASDDEGGNLTYSLTGDDASALSISASGVLTFNSAPNFEVKTSYAISVSVSDGVNVTSADLTINITNANDVPVISGLEATYSIVEGTTVISNNLVATDEDDDAIILSLSGNDASLFQITSSTTLEFKAATSYASPTDANTDNVYEVTVEAADGTITSSFAVSVTITSANQPPALNVNYIELNENSTAVAGLTLSDPNNDQLTVTINRKYDQQGYTSSLYGSGVGSGNDLDGIHTKILGNEDGTDFILSSDLTFSSTDVVKVVSNIQIAEGVILNTNGADIYGDVSSRSSFRRIEVRSGHFKANNGKIRKLNISFHAGDANNPGSITLFSNSIISATVAGASGNAIYGSYEISNNYFEDVNPGNFMYFWYPVGKFIILKNTFYNSGTLSVGARADDLDGAGNPLIWDNVFAHNNSLTYPQGSNTTAKTFINVWAMYDGVRSKTLDLQGNVYVHDTIQAFVNNTSGSDAENESSLKSTNEYFGVTSGFTSRYLDSSDNLSYKPVNVTGELTSRRSKGCDPLSASYGLNKFVPNLLYNGDGTFSLDVAGDFEACHGTFDYTITASDGIESITQDIQIQILNIAD